MPPQEIPDKVLRPEKAEEAKLKARYPHLGHKPGGSDLLRKRLQKGVSWSSLIIVFHKIFRHVISYKCFQIYNFKCTTHGADCKLCGHHQLRKAAVPTPTQVLSSSGDGHLSPQIH